MVLGKALACWACALNSLFVCTGTTCSSSRTSSPPPPPQLYVYEPFPYFPLPPTVRRCRIQSPYRTCLLEYTCSTPGQALSLSHTMCSCSVLFCACSRNLNLHVECLACGFLQTLPQKILPLSRGAMDLLLASGHKVHFHTRAGHRVPNACTSHPGGQGWTII